MSLIGWGKPKIKLIELQEQDGESKPKSGVVTLTNSNVTIVDDATVITLPTGVEGSTTLIPTQGARQEAPLEGGGYADVKYRKSTYALNTTLYAVKGTAKPVEDHDGIVDKKYAITVQPEDPTCPGIYIEKATITVQDAWDAATGGTWQFMCDVLMPDDETDQIKWRTVTYTSPA